MTRKLFYAILIPILVSVAVSIVASVYTNQALERYLTGLDTESQFRDQTETVTRPLPGSYEESLSQIDTLMTESVGVIRSTSISRQDALIRSDADGDPGVVITNDGWMLFSSEYTQGIVGDVFAYEVWIGQNAYSIEQVVSDEISGLSFVKVNASGLDPVSFGDTVSATGGE